MRFQFYLLILFLVSNATHAQVFEKEFDLFSIRVDQSKTWFIPKTPGLKQTLQKEIIPFNSRVVLLDDYLMWDYPILIDDNFKQNDSSLTYRGFGYNISNAIYVLRLNDLLMVSIPPASGEYLSYESDDGGNPILDSGGQRKRKPIQRNETAFFLYNIKSGKVISDWKNCWMNHIFKGGILCEGNVDSLIDDFRNLFSFVSFSGEMIVPWMYAKDFCQDNEKLEMLLEGEKAKAIYGLDHNVLSEDGIFYYIDSIGKSHYFNFQKVRDTTQVDFYFTDMYNSYMRGGKIYFAEDMTRPEKYLAFNPNSIYSYYCDSISDNPSKNNIPFNTDFNFLLHISDFYIYNQVPHLETGTISSKLIQNDQEGSTSDSLDENGKKVVGVLKYLPGHLIVYSKKTKNLLHEFQDRHLLDFNQRYYLVGIQKIVFKNLEIISEYDYVIYDKDFKEIKRTSSKSDFYELK